tara:strand:+ start:389 stop:1126 length:738 start_codon:yes stop_codon:yes gene_type:complete
MSITAVLTLYKRPHTLIEQLNAVINQSVPPENIILWINNSDITIPEIPISIKNKLIIINSSKNFGVWARFSVGLLVSSEYICIFDDDTIPGRDWFKNCLTSMNIKEGLYGTIGLKFFNSKTYDYEKPRMGWEGKNENIQQVDIVGHAWFFKQKWLSLLWQTNPDYNYMFTAGEDIAFSYILQKSNIPTYVPPHPISNPNLWGSDPTKANLYGTESCAISMSGGFNNFVKSLLYFRSKGFKLLSEN